MWITMFKCILYGWKIKIKDKLDMFVSKHISVFFEVHFTCPTLNWITNNFRVSRSSTVTEKSEVGSHCNNTL